MTLAAILVATAATQAPAADALWEGTWTPDLQRGCAVPESDGPPLVVASSVPKPGQYWQHTEEGGEASPSGDLGQIEFLRGADPSICYIKKITSIVDLPGWIFDVQCGGEGEIWDTRLVFLSSASGEQLTLFDGDHTDILFRCTAQDLLEPFGTNDKYGGNINATNGRGFLFLESAEPIGDRNGAVRATTLYRDAVGSFRSTSIVSCDPAYGQTGVVDLERGEIYPVVPDNPPKVFSSEMGNFDLWWIACRGHLHPSSPMPEWTKEIAAQLAVVKSPQ